jgi:hypothetical protein
VKKAQWITIGSAIILVAVIFIFGKTVPGKKPCLRKYQQADKRPDAPVFQ